MTVMRWFRKHRKRMLVVIGVIIMVAFGLPTTFFYYRGSRDIGKATLAYYFDSQKKRHDITQATLLEARRDLTILQELGIWPLTLNNMIYSIPGMQTIGIHPIIAVNMLLLPQPEYSRYARMFWVQQITKSDWVADQEQLEQITEQINQLSGFNPDDAGRYYLLLGQEARDIGIITPPALVEAFLKQVQQMGLKISFIRQQFPLPDSQFNQIIGNYLAILQYADKVTRSMAVSEPQIKKTMFDNSASNKISGKYVVFEVNKFLKDIHEPNLAQLQVQFQTYKGFKARQYKEKENPFGFGYTLDPRVQLEYLRVDLSQAQKLMEAQFAQQAPVKQEELLQKFWQDHREQFKVEVKPATTNTPAEYRYQPFDETASQVRQQKLQQEARQWAERLLAQAKAEAQKIMPRSALLTLKPEERRKKAADYKALSQQYSDPALKIEYGQTAYLDYDNLNTSPEFAGAVNQLTGKVQLPLADITMHCAALRKGTVSRLDEAPRELYEEIDSIIVPNKAVYLVRIINVDQERQPVSLWDDGLSGHAQSSAPPGEPNSVKKDAENPLYKRVKEDWKTLKAYQRAYQQAEKFAQQAAQNWDQTIKDYNKSTGDPNKPENIAKRLREDALDTVSRLLKQNEEFINKNPSFEAILRANIEQQKFMLYKATNFAWEHLNQPQNTPVILNNEQERQCLVIKDLKVQPPTQQEYLRLKPLLAGTYVTNNQGLMILNYLFPPNIEKRNSFTENKMK